MEFLLTSLPSSENVSPLVEKNDTVRRKTLRILCGSWCTLLKINQIYYLPTNSFEPTNTLLNKSFLRPLKYESGFNEELTINSFSVL